MNPMLFSRSILTFTDSCNITKSMVLKQLQQNLISFSIIFNLGLKCFGEMHTPISRSDAFSVLLRSVNMIYDIDVTAVKRIIRTVRFEHDNGDYA